MIACLFSQQMHRSWLLLRLMTLHSRLLRCTRDILRFECMQRALASWVGGEITQSEQHIVLACLQIPISRSLLTTPLAAALAETQVGSSMRAKHPWPPPMLSGVRTVYAAYYTLLNTSPTFGRTRDIER